MKFGTVFFGRRSVENVEAKLGRVQSDRQNQQRFREVEEVEFSQIRDTTGGGIGLLCLRFPKGQADSSIQLSTHGA